MDLKTSAIVLASFTTPTVINAQKAIKVTTPKIEQKIDTVIHNKNAISFAEAQRAQALYNIKTTLFKTPPMYMTPNPKMANKTVGKFRFDDFGNIDRIYNDKKQVIKTITRYPAGELSGFSEITRHKNGAKDTETLYRININDEIEKYGVQKFHGNGTATMNWLDESGNIERSSKFKTEIVDGDEVLFDKIGE